MPSNDFQILLNKLDFVPISTKNLVVNELKECKEKIAQVPKNIMPYVRRYGPVAVPLATFATGMALYAGGIIQTAKYYPEDLTGFYTAIAGALIAGATTIATALYASQEIEKKYRNASTRKLKK